MVVFRLGFLANFLSHPAISGFIAAFSLLIATGQLKHLLDVAASGHSLFEMALSLGARLRQMHWPMFVIGAAAAGVMFWSHKGLKPALIALNLPARAAALLARTGPFIVVALLILAVRWLDMDARALLSSAPCLRACRRCRCRISIPPFGSLAPAAFLIALIGFVESVSVAQTLAAKRRHSISPDQELMGLGMADFAAAHSASYPMTVG